nr:hypothetical protein BaRGS_011414 [Batillaria attramentaria]
MDTGPGMRGGNFGMGNLGMGGGMMMNKRRQDMNQTDVRMDYKRQRRDYRSPRRDSGKDKDDARDKKDQFYCHVCKISCNDAGSFRLHMNGARHKKRMVDVLAEHQEKSSQLMARMKAEEHLRKIETKERSGRWCKICDQQINVRFADHARQVVHVKRLMQVNRGCGWCNTGPFNNFSEVLAHRETKEHKERQAEHEGDKGSRDERGRGSRGRSPRGGSERRSDRERRDKREESKASPKKRAEIKIELPAKLQKFDPNTPVGQNCIVPVTGFFCKLCNKFYNNEAAAKDTHCKTEPHFTKYQKFLYEKLKAKAEAERDAAEKAAAEEEKKAKADAVKTETEGNEHEGDEEDASHEPVDEDGEKAGEEAGEENQDTHANEEEEGAEDVTEKDQGGEGEEEGGEGEDPQGEEREDPQGEEEQAENAILAEDSSALQYSFYDEAEEEHLLNEGETDGSAYATAGDDTLALDSANTTANDAKEGMGMSGVSLNAGGSVSEFLVDTSQTEEGDTEDQVSV